MELSPPQGDWKSRFERFAKGDSYASSKSAGCVVRPREILLYGAGALAFRSGFLEDRGWGFARYVAGAFADGMAERTNLLFQKGVVAGRTVTAPSQGDTKACPPFPFP